MKKLSIYFLSLVFILISCEELDLMESDPNVPVVESYLMPGGDISVKIVKQLVYASEETSYEKIDQAEVSISDGENTWLLENAGSGKYTSGNIPIMAGKEFTLSFEYNDKQVTAYTNIPEKPKGFEASESSIEAFTRDNFMPGSMPEMPDPLVLSWDNDSSEYYMIVVENIESSPQLIDDSFDRPERVFRNMPTQGTEQSLNVQTFMYYGEHRVILYHLNAEYAALYEQLSNTSLDITAPPSNVENGLGIFTGINSDTLYIEVI